MDTESYKKYLKYKKKYMQAKNMFGGYGELKDIYDKYISEELLRDNYTLNTINVCGEISMFDNQRTQQNIDEIKPILEYFMQNILDNHIKNDFYYALPIKLFLINYIIHKIEGKRINLLRSSKHYEHIQQKLAEEVNSEPSGLSEPIDFNEMSDDYDFSEFLKNLEPPNSSREHTVWESAEQFLNKLKEEMSMCINNNQEKNLEKTQKINSSSNLTEKQKSEEIIDAGNELSREIRSNTHYDKVDVYRPYLISVNLSLFGNDYDSEERSGESTYDYWLKNSSQTWDDFITNFSNRFPHSEKYTIEKLDKFKDAVNTLCTNYEGKYKKGILMQILIPDNKLDEYTYLCIDYGRPIFDLKTSDFLGCSVQEQLDKFYNTLNKLDIEYPFVYSDTKKIVDKYKCKPNFSCIKYTTLQARIVTTSSFINDDTIKVFYHCLFDLSELDRLIDELQKS